MGYRVYRPYEFPDRVDPEILKELRRLGVTFEPELHSETDAIVCLLGVKVDAALLDLLVMLNHAVTDGDDALGVLRDIRFMRDEHDRLAAVVE